MRTTNAEPDIWDRWGALGGIIFVASFIVGAVFYFGSGSPDHDTPSSVTSFLSAHRAGLEASWAITIAGLFFLIPYFGAFAMAVRKAAGGWGAGLITFLVTGTMSVILSLAAAAVSLTAVVFTVNKSLPGVAASNHLPDVTYGLYMAGNAALNDASQLATGAVVLVAGSLILSTGAFRRWLGWVGVAAGVLTLVSSLGLAVDALQIPGLVGGILSFVLIVGTSISMLKPGSAVTAPSRVPVGANA